LQQQQHFIQQSAGRKKGNEERAASGRTEGQGQEGMKEGKRTRKKRRRPSMSSAQDTAAEGGKGATVG
jgi:hypothetical protein